MSDTNTKAIQPVPKIDYSKLAGEIAERLVERGAQAAHPCTFDKEAIDNLKKMASAYADGKLIPGLDDDTIKNMKTFSEMTKKASTVAYGVLVTAIVSGVLAAFWKGLIAIVKSP